MSKTNGPRVTLKMSCADCSHCENVPYRVQGDSGHDVYCRQPEADHGHIKRIGDTTWDTPGWCPLRPPGPDEIRAQLSASDAACAMLRAERDALRSLLVRARPHVYSDALDLEAWADGVADELAKAARAVVADIDAALKEKS